MIPPVLPYSPVHTCSHIFFYYNRHRMHILRCHLLLKLHHNVYFVVLFTIFISAFLFCKSSPAKKTKPVNSTSTTRKTSSPSNSKKRVQQKTQGNAKSKQNSSNASNAKAKSETSSVYAIFLIYNEKKAKILYGTLNRLTPQEMLIT